MSTNDIDARSAALSHDEVPTARPSRNVCLCRDPRHRARRLRPGAVGVFREARRRRLFVHFAMLLTGPVEPFDVGTQIGANMSRLRAVRTKEAAS